MVFIAGDTDTGVGVGRVFLLIKFAAFAYLRARRLKPDVVISDPPPTAGLAALFLRPHLFVYYIADSWAEMLSQGGGRLAKAVGMVVGRLENFVLRRSDLVISVRESLSRLAAKAGAKSIITSPYGTDTVTFAPGGETWTGNPFSGVPYFLYAGNYGVVQGGTVFCEAARILWKRGVEFAVIFIGYGSDAAAVQGFCDEFPNRASTFPPVDANVAAAAYRGAVGSLASMRPLETAHETRPAKALASISCGCPVVFAGDGPFVTEVNQNSLGYAVPYDPVEVADAMSHILRDSAAGDAERRRLISVYGKANLDIRPRAVELALRIVQSLSG